MAKEKNTSNLEDLFPTMDIEDPDVQKELCDEAFKELRIVEEESKDKK